MRTSQKMDSQGRFRKTYTPEEDERLRELVSQVGFDEAAKRMKRPPAGVKAYAQRMGYSIGDRDGWYTLSDVTGILGVTYWWVRNRIERGMLKAKQKKNGASEKGGVYWVIREKDLRDFVRRYPQDLYNKPVDIMALVDLLCPDGLLIKKH